ncbi:hypothetical protein N8Z47_00210 [Salibacteraceae bacterium]|nr:hypothetical protein [Salibacteraceae bacterium]
MTQVRYGFLSLIFLTFSLEIKAQESFGEKPELVFNNIYDFNLLTADSLVAMEMPLQADSALWNLLSANVAWMQILAGNVEDEYWNKQFSDRILKAKRNLKSKRTKENDKLFYFIIVHAFKTRHELLGENYLNAAADLNTCIDQISQSFGRETEYEPFYLTSGLYYYFMSRAYEDYFILRPYLSMFPDGDKTKGLSYLNRLTKNEDVFLRNESNYFLMRIYLDLEEEYDLAKAYAEALVEENPNNLIFSLYHIKILQKLDFEAVTKEVMKYKSRVQGNNQLTALQKEHFLNELNME